MMTASSSDRLELPHDTASVSRARSFVRERCAGAGLPRDLCDTAALLTSETVTNSFVHGRSDAHLAVSADASGVLVEVGDDEVRRPLRRREVADALSGRGLLIVDRLANAWGSYSTPMGKVVWFRLDCDSVKVRQQSWC